MKRAIVIFLLVCPVAAARTQVVVPVATARYKGRIYSTTVAFKNASAFRVACRMSHTPVNRRTALTSSVEIEAGQTLVIEDFLQAVGAIGSATIDCVGDVVIAARIQDLLDDGSTFRADRVFAGLPASHVITDDAAETIRTQSDLALVDVAGKQSTIYVRVTDDSGSLMAERTYDMPPRAFQFVNVEELSGQGELQVHVTVKGEGSIAFARATDDSVLGAIAMRMPAEGRPAAEAHFAQQRRLQTQAEAAVPAHYGSVIAPMASFKAAPFQEPATGLILMRRRWYDPATGTFLTPDPMGYADSSNPYAYAKADPVNYSDPTGLYIDESRILNSPLRNKYVGWRDAYLRSPLGRQVWDQLHRIPASIFTLEMAPMAVNPRGSYATGAETTNFFDATGVQHRAVIEFSPKFGGDPGTGPPNATYYGHGIDVYQRDSGGFIPYAFGHEMGHVLGGWDPSLVADAKQFSLLGTQINATIPQFTALRQMQNRTPAQQQLLLQLTQQRSRWLQQQIVLKNTLEPYADDIGFQIYRSFRQAHPRWLGIQPIGGRTPPAQLPPGATANIPTASTP